MTEEIKQGQSQRTVSEKRPAKRRQYSAEEKMRIVIAGLRDAESIAELCRSEGINQNLYYRWHNEFLEAGKGRLAGNTSRQIPDCELRKLRAEAEQLKQLLGELMLENRMLRKRVPGDGETGT